MNTSITGWCLRLKVYARFSIIYAIMTAKTEGNINQLQASAVYKVSSNNMAVLTEIEPDANGRVFDFLGCRRSLSKSLISLMIYVADDAMQNNKLAISASLIASLLVKLSEKTKGAKTKPFLIHCLGRVS